MPITWLVPVEGGEPISLAKPKMLLGRRMSCDIHVTASNVSSHHCLFEYCGSEWVVRDLNSTNGTRVNGQRIAIRVIHSGDKVTIAKTQFVVEMEPASV